MEAGLAVKVMEGSTAPLPPPGLFGGVGGVGVLVRTADPHPMQATKMAGDKTLKTQLLSFAIERTALATAPSGLAGGSPFVFEKKAELNGEMGHLWELRVFVQSSGEKIASGVKEIISYLERQPNPSNFCRQDNGGRGTSVLAIVERNYNERLRLATVQSKTGACNPRAKIRVPRAMSNAQPAGRRSGQDIGFIQLLGTPRGEASLSTSIRAGEWNTGHAQCNPSRRS